MTLKFFNMQKWIYPKYRVTLANTGTVSTVPRRPAAIIMEVTEDGGNDAAPILSYDQSVKRLKAYMARHQPMSIPWLSDFVRRATKKDDTASADRATVSNPSQSPLCRQPVPTGQSWASEEDWRRFLCPDWLSQSGHLALGPDSQSQGGQLTSGVWNLKGTTTTYRDAQPGQFWMIVGFTTSAMMLLSLLVFYMALILWTAA